MSSAVTQAAILVGGLGTRLGSLTARTPKPLLEVAGRPFLDVLLLELARHGFREILLLAGFAGEQIEAYAANTALRQRFGLEIKVIAEQGAAGTGGALSQAGRHLGERFVLMNGDSWLDFNIGDLVRAHSAQRGCEAMLALRQVDDASRSGVAELEGGKLLRFLERPAQPGPALVNGGVYSLSRTILDHIPEICSLEKDVLPQLAQAGKLGGRAYGGFFLDIGIPSAFAEAQIAIPRQLQRGAVFFDRDGVLNIDRGHVGEIDRFEWISGAMAAIKCVNDAGLFAFVVTNQAGVAKGKYQEGDVHLLHAHMQQQLAGIGAHIDDFRYCPYHPDAEIPRYKAISPMRKPAPGMLIDLMKQWPVDNARSFLIGDQPTDIAAAAGAGISGYLFKGGNLLDCVTELLVNR